MNPFSDYFSNSKIINELCRVRIRAAESRNDRDYVRRLVGGQTHDHRRAIDELLPPRKLWAHFRPKHRRGLTNVDVVSLGRATSNSLESEAGSPRAMRLRECIATIQQRVLGYQSFSFSSPIVSWQVKENHKYRAICRFSLEDNVINSLVAKYLRDFFDPVFENSSYAFRARPDQGPMPTHHTAFNKLQELKSAAPTQDFFVAECDIRGFYDSVDHLIALSALQRLSVHPKLQSLNRSLDCRAEQVFSAYLDCFSYPQNILRETLPRLKQEDPHGDFPWPLEALRQFHADPMSQRIGIPQGGAISCIIANLVLDYADKQVEQIKSEADGEIRYLRYCDDMILLSHCKSDCRTAFKSYLEALEEMKLPYHEPEKVHFYDKAFWEFKSKQPYRWTGKKFFGCVPWIQFVGYQVRYDGLVRVKKKSVKKQLDTLKLATDELKFGLLRNRPRDPHAIQSSRNQAVQSLRHKLTAQGVGRIKLHRPRNGPMPKCWADGYKALNRKPFIPTFLKKLDRERERQIRRFMRADIVYGPGRCSRSHKGISDPAGFKCSYSAQFQNAEGWDLVTHPYGGSLFERLITERFYKLAFRFWRNRHNFLPQLYLRFKDKLPGFPWSGLIF
jgi:hypothetical protein